MSSPLPVYSLMPIELVRGSDCTVWDAEGTAYLDLYGGHAVISIGHAHQQWAEAIGKQAATLGYYSNSVHLQSQNDAATALGKISGREDCDVFFVNSGAEANENAFKLASFITGKPRVVAFGGAFHGRTSLAVAATDNPKIVSPVNRTTNITHVQLNDLSAVEHELKQNDVAAVIIEGIQGVGGVRSATDDFLRSLDALCASYGALLILDEIQSGSGRTGKYFAHDHAGIKPSLITVAKGIGNGFPVAAVLVSKTLPVSVGMLGTTFGGNPMACVAVTEVARAIERGNLMQNAHDRGQQLITALEHVPGIAEVRGRGLMIGVELNGPCSAVRKTLWQEHHILTGTASNPNVLRILPPLTITAEQIDRFVQALKDALVKETLVKDAS
ncbi:MAG: aminotransferase class III-fold pyridoxal phosphate-dependent enzyme [Bradyrhizobiaceae bacterium]|nr:aminotransferase class III-fold pyridoxal phosphate-dependent enzyme [Bradyrhizobiaceae bacterium]